ncbi:MAG: hypothetical protein D6791_17590 [Chloroflexi bacterium]|nr:MAG: hypothetical protein D6791_17590 [Chloroflexota bacterium]
MILSLEPELERALIEKSRELNSTPEALVIRLVRLFVEGQLLLPELELAEGITVEEYLRLTDAEEAALWERWSEEARRQVSPIIAEASPDALPPG